MAGPTKSWFPWLRFQRAVGTWAAGALQCDPDDAPIVWADFNIERPALPYLGLQVTSGPTRRGQDAESWPQLLPSVVDVQVLPSAVAATGDALRFFVNGELFEHIAALGDDEEAARDAILADVIASVQLGATAVATGTDTIRLTATEPGLLSVEASVGCTATIVSTALVAVTKGSREIRVRATAYGSGEPQAAGTLGVAEWIELLVEGTQVPELRDALRRQGYVVTRTTILQTRQSAMSGAEREPRVAADIMFSCNVRRGRIVDSWLDEVVLKTPVV